MLRKLSALSALALLGFPGLSPAQPPVFDAEIVEVYPAFDAYQGVAVDAANFYAVNNFRITKHEKAGGEALLQWDGGSAENGSLIHLDGGVVLNGRLYAAHSNYPRWPMTSSIEIWDTATMTHVDNHSFGVMLGSLTWIDRHDGYWWGTFANYDRVQRGMDRPYGETANTVVVQMDDGFAVLQSWTLPAPLLARMTPMSNSGGSWGADGYLYLTGHDYPEIYVMQLPDAGAELEWVATIHVPGLNGQGIAWDRSSGANELWAILRARRQVFRIRMPEISARLAGVDSDFLREPGEFVRDRGE